MVRLSGVRFVVVWLPPFPISQVFPFLVVQVARVGVCADDHALLASQSCPLVSNCVCACASGLVLPCVAMQLCFRAQVSADLPENPLVYLAAAARARRHRGLKD